MDSHGEQPQDEEPLIRGESVSSPGARARPLSILDTKRSSLTDTESLFTLRSDYIPGKPLPYPLDPIEDETYERPWRGHHLQPYRTRNVLNIIGPIVFVSLYVFIIFGYLEKETTNDLISNFGRSRVIFYGWFVISVFALEWANSGLAGTEAGGLMKPFIAPQSPRQLLWHADRAWSTFSGWLRGVWVTLTWAKDKRKATLKGAQNRKPGRLWWYLTCTSMLIYLAVPLSGLTMELGDAYKLGDEPATVNGPNATTFNEIFPPAITFRIRNSWAANTITSYQDKASFVFAREGTKNASKTYYNDAAHSQGNSSSPIVAFFPPATQDSVHGTAWGIQLSVNCHPVDPYTDLDIFSVYHFRNSTNLNPPYEHRFVDYKFPYSNNNNSSDSYVNFASSQRYLEIVAGASGSNLPGTTASQSLEMVLWQTSWDLSDLKPVPDPAFDELRKLPFVREDTTRDQSNETVLGFGIHCDVQSVTGTAKLNNMHRTYSNFTEVKSVILPNDYKPEYEETLEQVYILAANILTLSDNAWLDMNTAIGAELYSIYSPKNLTNPINIYPLISPENATLALYKLIGQAAISVMDDRKKPWQGELKSLKMVKTLVKGKVPWQLVLALLGLWMISSVVGSILSMNIYRRASFLDGFEIFKLGYNAAHGREPQKFDGYKFYNCQELEEAPNALWYIHNNDKISE